MPYRYSQRGDPGLFGFLGSAIRTVAGALPGPAGTIGRLLTGQGRPPPLPPMMTGGAGRGIRPQRMSQIPKRGVVAAVQRAIPGGATGMEAIPRGYRPNKSGYFTIDGQYHAPGTKLVRVRRRNPANARALRRSLSRVEAFGGIVKRVRKTTRRLRTI